MADARQPQLVADVMFSMEPSGSGEVLEIFEYKVYIQYSVDRQFLWTTPLSQNVSRAEEAFTLFEVRAGIFVYQSSECPCKFAVVKNTYLPVERELFPAPAE